jgi:S1-C subfamily serine protease
MSVGNLSKLHTKLLQAGFILLLFVPIVSAGTQKFRDWTVEWSEQEACGKPAQLSVRGPGNLLESGNSATLEGLIEEVSAALRKRCPDLRDAVVVLGRTQKLVKLKQGPAAPSPSPSPATLAEKVATGNTEVLPVTPPKAAGPAVALSAVPSIPNQPLRRLSLAGEWIGVYHVYPAFVSIGLKVRSEPDANGFADAELRLEGLMKDSSNVLGLMQAKLKYAAESRVIEIDASTDQSVGTLPPRLSLRGVFSEELKQFSGIWLEHRGAESPYFVMARSQDAEELFLKELRGSERPRPGGAFVLDGPITFGRGIALNGSVPPVDKLKQWAMQMLKEHPSLEPHSTESGSLFSIARNLFRDEYFIPFFGKPFEKLGAADLNRTETRLREIPAPRANFPEEKAQGAAHTMSRAFSRTGGTYTAKDVNLSVLSLRGIDLWRKEWLRDLPKMPNSSSAFQVLSTVEAQLESVLSMHWPSEQKQFETAIEAARARLSAPVLVTKLDRLLEEAQRFEAIPELRNAMATLSNAERPAQPSRTGPRNPRQPRAVQSESNTNSLGSIAGYVPENIRSEQTQRLASKVSQLAEMEAIKDRERIGPFGSGLIGLETGLKWHRDFESKYRSLRQETSVKALYAAFLEKRTASLEAAKTEVIATIGTADTKVQVQQLLSKLLDTRFDEAISGGRAILAAAGAREMRLDQLAVERAQKQREEMERKAKEAEEAAEKAWRRRRPGRNEIIVLSEKDFQPKPNVPALERAMAAVLLLSDDNGHGSGFLISKDGLAITNHHVIDGGNPMTATLTSGQKCPMRVLRSDQKSDFALVQIACPQDCFTSILELEGLPSVGSEIFAIGTPRERKLNNTVSKGIVGGIRPNGIINDIQIDAPVNPGNSGGPIVDAVTGKVLGVVTWKRTDAEGIGFAGSILDALKILGVSIK